MSFQLSTKSRAIFFWIVSALIIPGFILAAIIFRQVLLQGTGNSLGTLTVFWTLFNGPLTIGIGLAIMRRVRQNPVGPLLVLWGIQNILWAVPSELTKPFAAAFALGIGVNAGAYLYIYFPNGKPFPERAALLYQAGFPILLINAILFVLSHATFQTVVSRITKPHILYVSWLSFLQPITEALFYCSLVLWLWGPLTLVLRYRHATRQERVQIKWMAFLGLLIVPLTVVVLLADASMSKFNPSLSAGFLSVSYTFAQIAPGIIIGISVLRYRLWDIDILIRRTLQYGLLSLLLGLIYSTLVVVLGKAFQISTGQESPLAVVLSTLAIAALFTPLRRRLQTIIDRRFYRQKYDTARALEGFSTVARNEVGLDVISQCLTAVAQEALQPERISLWLKKQEDHQ